MHISARRGRRAAWIALPLAVVASGSVIATASYAAFSDTTDNGSNTWQSASIALHDDDQGTALFTAEELVPGDTDTNCITVTADTTRQSTVQVYTTDSSTPNELSAALALTVERGELPENGSCTADFTKTDDVFAGSLSDLMRTTSFGDGVGTWTPAPGTDTATYRFHYQLDPNATNAAQDSEARTTFVWEAQND